MELIEASEECLLTGSPEIPIGTPGTDPSESLAPSIGGLLEDDEDAE